MQWSPRGSGLNVNAPQSGAVQTHAGISPGEKRDTGLQPALWRQQTRREAALLFSPICTKRSTCKGTQAWQLPVTVGFLEEAGQCWGGTLMLPLPRKPSACVYAMSLQLCQTLCDPMDCSSPGSSVHGILQARILGWMAMPSSRGSSSPRD